MNECCETTDNRDVWDERPAVPDRFRVHDEASANWLIRRILEARAYGKHVKDWAERELRRADKEEAFFYDHYWRELETWMQGHLQATKSRRRSVSLPAGVVGHRKQQAKLVIRDESLILPWAEANCPDAIETITTTRLKRSVLTQHVTRTGEVPPEGVIVQPEHDRLYISPRK